MDAEPHAGPGNDLAAPGEHDGAAGCVDRAAAGERRGAAAERRGAAVAADLLAEGAEPSPAALEEALAVLTEELGRTGGTGPSPSPSDGRDGPQRGELLSWSARINHRLVLLRLDRFEQGYGRGERALAVYHGYLADRVERELAEGAAAGSPGGHLQPPSTDRAPSGLDTHGDRERARARLSRLPGLLEEQAAAAAAQALVEGGSGYETPAFRAFQDRTVLAAREVREADGAVGDVTLAQAALAVAMRAVSTGSWNAECGQLLDGLTRRQAARTQRGVAATSTGGSEETGDAAATDLAEVMLSAGHLILVMAQVITAPRGITASGSVRELKDQADRAEQLIRRLEDHSAGHDPRTLAWPPLLHGMVGMILSVASLQAEPPAEASALRLRAEQHLGRAPAELRDASSDLTAAGDVWSAVTTGRGGADPDDVDEVARATQRLRKSLGGVFGELGGELLLVLRLAERAQRTRDLADIDAALDAARAARGDLPAGHGLNEYLVPIIAHLWALRAGLSRSRQDAAAAVQAAADAVAVVSEPGFSVVYPLVEALGIAVTLDPRGGRRESAEKALSDLLHRDDLDAPTRAAATAALGMAIAARWAGGADVSARDRAREQLTRAVRGLRELPEDPEAMQLTAALLQHNLALLAVWGDPTARDDVNRLADELERRLDADPDTERRFAELVAPGLEALPGGLVGFPAKLLPRPDPSGGPRQLITLARSLAGTLGTLSAISDSAPVRALFPDRLSFAETAETMVDAALHQADLPEPPATARIGGMMRAALAGLAGDGTGFREAYADATGTPTTPGRPSTEWAASRLRAMVVAAQAFLPADRRPLSAERRPDPAALEGAVTRLRAALTDAVGPELVPEAENLLGVCLAELYWAGAAGPEALDEAITYLDRGRDTEVRTTPDEQRADRVDVQACCHAELGRLGLVEEGLTRALGLVRAALGELGRCVLLQRDPADALRVAERADRITGRALSWCLEAGRAEEAVEVVENGRALVLGAAVLAGRVPQRLRALGAHEAARVWEEAEDLDAAFAVLSAAPEGVMLLRSSNVQDVGVALNAARLDALVYLVPPAVVDPLPPGRPWEPRPATGLTSGHALVVLPTLRHDVVPLPGVDAAAGALVERYQTAYRAALAAWNLRGEAHPLGFRGSPEGRAWCAALDDLGAWVHAAVIAPLLDRFGIDLTAPPAVRPLRLAVVPVGDLAAVPFAAAWTADPGLPGGRRYAAHDLVLSQTASARLLAEVAGRRADHVAARPVFLQDPTGELFLGQFATDAVVEAFYPHARVYGPLGSSGPGAPDDVLAALGGQTGDAAGDAADDSGAAADAAGDGAAGPASVLHLVTHAQLPGDERADPLAGTLLQVGMDLGPSTGGPAALLQDGPVWLSLRTILERARRSRSAASCGLVVCDACVTDLSAAFPDESLTLATAFLAAGASAAIGTRWPLDDDTAAVFAFALHAQLARGVPPGEALRAAQLWMLDPQRPALPGLPPMLARERGQGRWTEPASWAGYTYHGGWAGPSGVTG
jgi:hypothetical protein